MSDLLLRGLIVIAWVAIGSLIGFVIRHVASDRRVPPERDDILDDNET
jgi:hypothetical protein